jgi:hypothetical protein
MNAIKLKAITSECVTAFNMAKAGYTFNTNLLKLSRSNDIHVAKTEWLVIYKEQRPEKTGLCICQHTLKNVTYMYNIYSKYTICVGTSCCKKFNLSTTTLGNTALREVAEGMLRRGEYSMFDNIIEYANSIETQLLIHIQTKYEKTIHNLNGLKHLHSTTRDLVDNYALSYLANIYDEIADAMIRAEHAEYERRERVRATMRKERVEREKKEQEKREIMMEKRKKEQDEREKDQREYESLVAERKEREQDEREKCGCGILQINVCTCKIPKYEPCRLSRNLYCAGCKKWKCRCEADKE